MPGPSLTFTLAEFARCAEGRLVGSDCAFEAISIDTRTLTRGALFIALRGDRFDGHEFAAAAATAGACGALVEHELPLAIPQIVVGDALAALTACARAHRRRFDRPVVAVTGSNGKTTTKEMLGAILGRRGPCLVTRGNLNNHIGVPLTLLGLRDEHVCAVIEMGANHRGEIAHLTSIAAPAVGVVTNAGSAHLEGFGSADGVAAGKGELFAGLPPDGTAVINTDDRYAPVWRSTAGSRPIVTFGIDAAADFTARDIASSLDAGGPRLDFELVTPHGAVRAHVRLAGSHNVLNALAAAAAAATAGAALADITAGLAGMAPVHGRLEVRPALNGALLVDDSYNANPASLQAGLDAFRACQGIRWLILGDMLELGPAAADLHADVGRYAKTTGVARLLAVGTHARHAADAFGEGGAWFETVDALIEEARRTLTADTAVLVKGSRGSRLERVATALSPSAQEAH